MSRLHKKYAWLLSLLLLTCFVLLPCTGAAAATTDAELLDEVRQHIKDEFVNPVDKAVLEKTSVQEMVESLNDPYSVYYTPEEYARFRENTDQIFDGIGMQVELLGEYVTVVAPLKNTPAQKAGIESGDKVLAVNGEDMVGKSLDYVVSKIRGKAGAAVVLTMQREGERSPLVLTVTRATVHMEIVEWKLLQEGIGYVHLTSFSQKAGQEFDNAVAVLKAKGMEALVFDLRQNPGGYLNAGLNIASDFAAKGDILLHVVGRDGIKDSYQSLSASLGIPTVVLVDGGSASASEIVAGAIQDLASGKLVGTQTFGKASVQTVFGLSDGGALKLTTAKYLTPKEREIHGVGLTPDYVVEGEEAQLRKAVELLEAELGIEPKAPVPLKITLSIHENRAKVGEKEVALEAMPYEIEGRILVPVRFMAEAFGGQVQWDKDSSTMSIQYNDQKISFTPGVSKAQVNGNEVGLPVPAQLKNGRTFVPLRFISESLGAQVYFDKAASQIQIIK